MRSALHYYPSFNQVEVVVLEEDLKVETYRSQGAGEYASGRGRGQVS
jgi:protein subunit release factor A